MRNSVSTDQVDATSKYTYFENDNFRVKLNWNTCHFLVLIDKNNETMKTMYKN